MIEDEMKDYIVNANRKEDIIKKRYTKTIGYVCQRCWTARIVTINTTLDFPTNSTFSSKKNKYPIINEFLEHGITMTCPDCRLGDPFMFPCEKLMVPYVLGFNRKGFTTKMCCHGHYEANWPIDCINIYNKPDRHPSNPWISFDLTPDKHEIFNDACHIIKRENPNKFNDIIFETHVLEGNGTVEYIDILESHILVMSSERKNQTLLEKNRKELFEFLDLLYERI